MDHEQYDLLISAYLDDELNADERAQVEQLLATNAEARQLIEELRAIRAGLQGLPRHQLEPDFAQQVIRRAEQTTQASAPAPAKELAKAAILPQHDPWQPSVFRSRRGVVWSLAAIAAAVIIMVATRKNEQNDRQVAQQAAKAPVPQNQSMHSQIAEDKLAQEEPEPRREPQMQPSAAPGQSPEKKEGFADSKTSNRAMSESGATWFSDQPAPQNNVAGNLAPQMRSDAGAASSSDGLESNGVSLQRNGGTAAKIQAAAPPSSIDSNPVMIVQVGLKQKPAASNEFEQLLADNRIPLDFDQIKTRDEVDRKQDALGVKSAASGDVDVVYVETSPEQLAAILNELTKSKSLLSMSTTLSPPLPSSDKDLDKEAAPSSRARRSEQLHNWVAQHLNDLPQTIELSGNNSSVDESRILDARSKGSAATGGAMQLPAVSPAPPVTAQLHLKKSLAAESSAGNKAYPPPLARAVFVLRSVDAPAATNPAASTEPAAKPVPAEPAAPAAEKQ